MPKGVYDRATSKWVPPSVVYPEDLVERVRYLYGSGMSMKETAEAVGTTVKVLQRLMPRHGIERRKAAKRNQSGDANHMWKGDGANYQALHLRVQAARGRPNRCDVCGTADPSKRYEWSNLTGNYADINDYDRKCQPCHRQFDAMRRRVTGRPTMPSKAVV